jgi:Family of unknown function (DUF5994)
MTTGVRGTPDSCAGDLRMDPLPPRLVLAPHVPASSPAGAWWPRTHRPVLELSALVAGLASRGVAVTHLSLDVAMWAGAPGRLRLDGRDVRLTWFAYRRSDTVVVRHADGEITLLVIAPEASEAVAVRAMALVLDHPGTGDVDALLSSRRAAPHIEKA